MPSPRPFKQRKSGLVGCILFILLILFILIQTIKLGSVYSDFPSGKCVDFLLFWD